MMRNRISSALIAGDAVILLAFTIGGMSFHRSPDGFVLARVLEILLPFALSYLGVAYAVGAFQDRADGKSFALRSAAAWLPGILGGVLLRSLLLGRPPIPSFVGITLVFTGVCFLLWRATYWLFWGRRRAAQASP